MFYSTHSSVPLTDACVDGVSGMDEGSSVAVRARALPTHTACVLVSEEIDGPVREIRA